MPHSSSRARSTQPRSLVLGAFALVSLLTAFGAPGCGGGSSTPAATAGTGGGAAGATGGTAGTTAGTGGMAGGTAGTTGATGGASGGTTGAAGGTAGATGGGAGQDGGATPDAADASSDGSPDAVAPTDANGGDADGGAAFCGAAPLDPIVFNMDATMSFKGTGTFTSNGCVGKSIPWSSGSGPFPINLTDGATVWVRMDPVSRVGDPAFLPTYFPELKPIAGFDKPVGALLWDVNSVATLKTLVPSFNQPTMSIITVATVLNKTGTAPCDVNTGVTFAVPGHAEAVVVYAASGGAPGAGTSTSTDGTAWITLLPASALEYVTVVGTKAGCTVRNAGYIYTGRIPVAPGTTSSAVAF